MDAVTWIWLIAGIVLLLSEIIIPGAVVAFLGVGAMLIALGRWAGWIDGVMDSFMYWFVLSMALVLLFRGVLTKMFPSASHVEYADEDLEAFGQMVEVLEEIRYEHEQGRVRFRDSSWAATSSCERVFLPGEKVRLIGRCGLVWMVEAHSPENLEAHFNVLQKEPQ